MKLFEVVIDQTGFGIEAVRETLHRELTPSSGLSMRPQARPPMSSGIDESWSASLAA